MDRETLIERSRNLMLKIQLGGKLLQHPAFHMICKPAQNLPSIACGHALIGDGESVASGAHVLDMCAAPGGKTTHLAAKLAAANTRAKVLAFDKSKNKVGLYSMYT